MKFSESHLSEGIAQDGPNFFERQSRTADVEARLRSEYEAIEKLMSQPDILDEEEIFEILDLLESPDGTVPSYEQESQSLQLLRQVIDRITRELGDDTLAQTFYRVLPQGKRKALKNKIAQYHRLSGKITFDERKMDDQPVSPTVGLLWLSRMGFIHSFVVLHHEFIHSLQSDPPREEIKKAMLSVLATMVGATALSFASGEYSPLVASAAYLPFRYFSKKNTVAKKIIRETHAFIGSLRHAAHPQSVLEHIEEMFEKSYGVKGKASEMKKFYSAHDDIRRLYALGYSDAEIARLVKGSRWDAKRQCYDSLENEVEHATTIQHYTESDVDNLVCVSELEQMRNELQIRRITQEELQKYKKK